VGDFYNRGGGGVSATTITATTITADDLEVDGGTLSIDETNNRVGVGLTTPKTALTVEGPVTLKEQANADGDTAAYGQLWVKTATPNELYFTTDAGNDIQITSGTGIVSGSVSGAQTGITSVLNASLVIGRDADNDIDFGTDDNIIFRAAAADQIVLKDGVLEPVTDADVDLGSSSKQFKDGHFHGTLEADAITVNGDTLAEVIQDTVGAMVGSNTETGISVTYEDGDGTLDFVLDAVGTAAIADDAVTVAKIEDLARGQIIYGNASGETAKLSPGSANQVLTSDGQDISWQNASGGGATLDLNLILHTQVFGR
tara:strand:+ start:1348 stop:2289 length:942 start_codon:yes stop_codon:yes gene_type:complete